MSKTKPRDPLTPDTPRRRCTAKSKRSGERCRSAPVKGASVCIRHGGAAPQVRAKARERLMMLAEPAVVLLGRILRDEKVSPADRIRAALGVLDRTGFPVGLKIEAELEVAPWQQMLKEMWEGDVVERQRAISNVDRQRAISSAAPANPGSDDEADEQIRRVQEHMANYTPPWLAYGAPSDDPAVIDGEARRVRDIPLDPRSMQRNPPPPTRPPWER